MTRKEAEAALARAGVSNREITGALVQIDSAGSWTSASGKVTLTRRRADYSVAGDERDD